MEQPPMNLLDWLRVGAYLACDQQFQKAVATILSVPAMFLFWGGVVIAICRDRFPPRSLEWRVLLAATILTAIVFALELLAAYAHG